jgi:hypothetical protein
MMVGGWDGGRMSWWCVTQLVKRRPDFSDWDLAERGALLLAFFAPAETDADGTNSSDRTRVIFTSGDAIELLTMTSHA